jgi:hypothetical protein
MSKGSPQTLRFPLVLLAAANLAFLGWLLWPWSEALTLPVGGTTAFDPTISLAAYIGLLYWISSGVKEVTAKALSAGAMIGLIAGLILVVRVLLGVRTDPGPGYIQAGLLGVAVILWGVAGLRGSWVAGNAGMGALSGLWSAMVSGLLACTAILAELYLAGPWPGSPDPWKQYQGLAIGNSVTQGLVNSLNAATGFLLLGPLAGAAAGLLFAFFGQSQKS